MELLFHVLGIAYYTLAITVLVSEMIQKNKDRL